MTSPERQAHKTWSLSLGYHNLHNILYEEVYQLTNETLQAHLKLDMSNSLFEAQDIWDVLIAAAVERITPVSPTWPPDSA